MKAIICRRLIGHQEKTLLTIRNNVLHFGNNSSYNCQDLFDAADDIDECIAELKLIREAI